MGYASTLHDAWRSHLADRQPDAPTVISTFAGIGGSSLGYSMAGYHELLAVEFNQRAAATFRVNFPTVPVYEGDITALSVVECMKRAGIRPRELTVLDGSPPCQGFSTVGRRALADPRNRLFVEYVRLLEGLQPSFFVLENVRGLVIGKMRLVFAEMLRALKGVGYDVTARVLNASRYGVPQSRPRLIVIGRRTDLAGPKLSHPPSERVVISAQDALLGVPDGPWARLAPVNRRIWRRARPGQDGGELTATGSLFSHRKVNPYRPVPTLTKEGGHNYLHWREPRPFSIAEAKRFGSFPDEFQLLDGAYGQQWAGIGNSVPPLLMQAIARHVRELHGQSRPIQARRVPHGRREPHERRRGAA